EVRPGEAGLVGVVAGRVGREGGGGARGRFGVRAWGAGCQRDRQEREGRYREFGGGVRDEGHYQYFISFSIDLAGWIMKRVHGVVCDSAVSAMGSRCASVAACRREESHLVEPDHAPSASRW